MAFGPMEWVIVIALVVLLFGATAIPKLARSMGRAQGEFQKARSEFQEEVERGRAESGAPAADKKKRSEDEKDEDEDEKS